MSQAPAWVHRLARSERDDDHLLSVERATSKIDVENLSDLLFTKELQKEKQEIMEILKANEVFDKSKDYFKGRIGRIKTALARGKKLRQLSEQYGWSSQQNQLASDLIGEQTPYRLHAGMFLVTLREQGTSEQHKLFLTKAERYEYIGCYAQTELGHGSNVRGLETTATWSANDRTFVINTPSLTAAKWWIGSLGRTANHAIVIAQLIINDVSYGPHPFVVQIRDLRTHQPLDNIYMGDIGPKLGFNTMDNGFLMLNKVKIPYVNMLSRFSQVNQVTGEYVKPQNPSLVYGTMTWVRSNIVLQSGSVLAQGVTIAVRYCAVRRQFRDQDTTNRTPYVGESQVLDYSMVQYRLFPLLAASFALHFTGREMISLYNSYETTRNTMMLADLHATSCALKAYASTTAGEGLEICRRACGGHGYSSFSGIGSRYGDYLPTLTWEGDNYMLTQQVSRYLLKHARVVLENSDLNSQENGITRVLRDFRGHESFGTALSSDILKASNQDIVLAFGRRVAFLTFEAVRKRDVEKRSWNSLLVDFWRLSTSYAQYLTVKSFSDALTSATALASVSPSTLDALDTLFNLYSFYTIETEFSQFLASGALKSPEAFDTIHEEAILKLLSHLRPNAVALVDAWKFPDWQLDSSLGRYDGQVYKDLFHRASQLNPLNEIVFDPYPNSETIFRSGSDDCGKHQPPIRSKI